MTYALMPQPNELVYTQAACALAADGPVVCPDNVRERLSAALDELCVRNGRCPIELSLAPGMRQEAYRLCVDEAGVHIEACDAQGLFYGLQTLNQMLDQARDGVLRGVRITDAPALEMRANLIDLRFQSFNIDYLIEHIRLAAATKINCVHIDYSDRFPYEGKYETIRDPDAFTREAFDRFVKYCRDHFVQIVPVVQSFGHMEYVLKDPAFAHLIENAEGGNIYRSQCCPMKDESLEMSKELIKQVYDAHNRPKYLSIGGDETFYLGACPACAAYAKEHGLGFLYLKRINELIDYVCGLGAIPICYADMALAYPEIVPHLDKRAVIGDWDYDTGDGEYDSIINWDTKGRIRVSELEDAPEPLRTILKEHVLGPDGRHFYSFGYLKYLKEAGFTAIGHCSTACVGPDDLWTPNYTLHMPNIAGYAAAAKRWGQLGVINCCWEAFLFETVQYGLHCGAECFWREDGLAPEPERRFASVYFGLNDPEPVMAMIRLSQPFTMVEKRWPKVKLPDIGRTELPLEQIYNNEQLKDNIQSAQDAFDKYRRLVPRNAFTLEEWAFGAQIKEFWIEMARIYDEAMRNPDDLLSLELNIAAQQARMAGLKSRSLAMHSPTMPVRWIMTRFNKAFEKLDILSKELRERDYRIGKNRR